MSDYTLVPKVTEDGELPPLVRARLEERTTTLPGTAI